MRLGPMRQSEDDPGIIKLLFDKQCDNRNTSKDLQPGCI